MFQHKKIHGKKSPLANCVVVGATDLIKGDLPVAFVVAVPGMTIDASTKIQLQTLVIEAVGLMAAPAWFIELRSLPQTRTGKYMRRMLRDVVNGVDERLEGAAREREEGTEVEDSLVNPESLVEARAAVEMARAASERTEVVGWSREENGGGGGSGSDGGGGGGGGDGGSGSGDGGSSCNDGVVQRLVIQLALEASTWTVVVKKDEKKKEERKSRGEEKEEEEGVLPMNQPLMHLGFDSMRLVLFRDSLIRHLPSVVIPPTLLLQLFGSKGLEAATLSIVIHELTTAVMFARELHALTFKWPCLSRRKEEETDERSSELKPRRRGMEASVLLERDSRHNKSQGKDGGLSPIGGLEACLRKKLY